MTEPNSSELQPVVVDRKAEVEQTSEVARDMLHQEIAKLPEVHRAALSDAVEKRSHNSSIKDATKEFYASIPPDASRQQREDLLKQFAAKVAARYDLNDLRMAA